MLIHLILSSFLVSGTCVVTAKNLLRTTGRANAVVGATISKVDLMHVFDFPEKMEGLVANLHRSENLAVFGVTDINNEEIQVIEIWGFSKVPLHLASIDSDGSVELFVDKEYLTVAFKDLPKLKKLFEDKEILPKLDAKKDYLNHEAVLDIIETDHKASVKAPLTWAEMFDRIYISRYGSELYKEAIRQQKNRRPVSNSAQPRPPAAEQITTTFAGWLSEAAVEATVEKRDGGIRVSLNSKYQNLNHPAFPDLGKRINLEERFQLEWLNIENPLVIELEALNQKEPMVMVIDRARGVPKGLRFYVLDPQTGLRVSDKLVRS